MYKPFHFPPTAGPNYPELQAVVKGCLQHS